eukprot:comp23910_c0_seq1/m.42130 comp23910_c0_seq1/g.42130  ORF comp23910_c0_seq1/g.42130 comp23910_c0_seq1/m.42130 type:complete len:323 (-) comp23910_c0_seq1:863-1831(-)
MDFLLQNPHFAHQSERSPFERHYGYRHPRYAYDEDMYGSPFGPSFWQPKYGRISQHDRQQRAYLQATRVRDQAEYEQRQREEFEQAQRQRYLEQLSRHTPRSVKIDGNVELPPENYEPTPMDVESDTPAPITDKTQATPATSNTEQPTLSEKRRSNRPRPTKAERRRRRTAATLIQTWWRALLQQRDTHMPDATEVTTGVDRMDEAARIITQAVRKVAVRKTTARVVRQIKQLSGIAAEAGTLRTEFYDKVFTKPVYNEKGKVNYALLGYVDMLEKLIIKTDDVPTYGQERVRQQRKATVKHIQSLLEEADSYRHSGPQRAA